MKDLAAKVFQIVESVQAFVPEILLMIGFVGIILVDLCFQRKYSKFKYAFVLSILLLTLWSIVDQLFISSGKILFLGMLQLDHIALISQLLIILAAVFTLVFFAYAHFFKKNQLLGEFLSILIAFTLGAFLMAMAAHLLMIYIAIELVSISGYIFTVFRFKKESMPGGIKYILFGAMASGIMLYGMSLLYGLAGGMELQKITAINFSQEPLAVLAGIFLLGGILFKLAAAPLHLWAPEVYEIAPTPILAFLSIAPKLGAFIILYRFLQASNFGEYLPSLISVLAIFSIFVGNLGALVQKNIKRMLAYSSIAQAGFLLASFIALKTLIWQIFFFYLIIYFLANFLIFLWIDIAERSFAAQDLKSYKGLGTKYPFLGVMLAIGMLALTGLPPTAGFSAKLFLFSGIWQAYQATEQVSYLYLFILGLLNTAIGLFYYIKVPFYMFFFKNTGIESNLSPKWLEKMILAVLGIGLLLLFFKADWLMEILDYLLKI